MDFDSSQRPVGHVEQLEGAWGASASGRLPHSLLLTGGEGTGKFLASQWLAAGMMCDQGPGWPCGVCGPCKRAGSGNHPDILVVDAPASGQAAITIGFVTHRKDPPKGSYDGQSIDKFLSLRAMEGGWKVVLIREVDRMNEAAQNAFLKTLEEPRPKVLLLLETSKPGSLLDTIKSRVVQVAFGRLNPLQTSEVLGRLGMDQTGVLARWSMGAPGIAVRLGQRGAIAMRDILIQVCRGELHPGGGAGGVWDASGDYPGKTAAAQKRLKAETFLDIGLELWLDLERSLCGVDENGLAHGDRLGELPPLSGVLRRRRLASWLRARQDVDLNMNPEALVDRVLVACRPEA